MCEECKAVGKVVRVARSWQLEAGFGLIFEVHLCPYTQRTKYEILHNEGAIMHWVDEGDISKI